ncbi:DUF2157 domain-containing protein [Tellurirhabdus rosea]|uniref:DUF2157 domain-containing protein n=1 Tax=Tellurirhabdus rosea TaxID=2674997 RepID=UPI0022573704|nr:DUF2157 domain-containing protein [Tellurirhabdus rosea]
MSPEWILDILEKDQILTRQHRITLERAEADRPFSVHWELRVMLYLGILLFTTGAGLLIYENLDRIGHNALLSVLTLLCAACFAFAFRDKKPYMPVQTGTKTPFGEYALLLGCLLFLTLEGYAQYTYTIFGTRYGLVTAIPAVLFIALAYAFDHRGVLSLGLTALISWVGVTIRPLEFYFKGNLRDLSVLVSALLLAVLLIAGALYLDHRRIKRHFTNTTLAFAGNLMLVALIAGLFNFPEYHLILTAVLAVVCYGFAVYARKEQSFLFLLMSTIYGYIGLTYLIFHYLKPGTTTAYLYWIVTGIGLIVYLLSYKKVVSK